jgi:hypothetical protein
MALDDNPIKEYTTYIKKELENNFKNQISYNIDILTLIQDEDEEEDEGVVLDSEGDNNLEIDEINKADKSKNQF